MRIFGPRSCATHRRGHLASSPSSTTGSKRLALVGAHAVDDERLAVADAVLLVPELDDRVVHGVVKRGNAGALRPRAAKCSRYASASDVAPLAHRRVLPARLSSRSAVATASAALLGGAARRLLGSRDRRLALAAAAAARLAPAVRASARRRASSPSAAVSSARLVAEVAVGQVDDRRRRLLARSRLGLGSPRRLGRRPRRRRRRSAVGGGGGFRLRLRPPRVPRRVRFFGGAGARRRPRLGRGSPRRVGLGRVRPRPQRRGRLARARRAAAPASRRPRPRPRPRRLRGLLRGGLAPRALRGGLRRLGSRRSSAPRPLDAPRLGSIARRSPATSRLRRALARVGRSASRLGGDRQLGARVGADALGVGEPVHHGGRRAREPSCRRAWPRRRRRSRSP